MFDRQVPELFWVVHDHEVTDNQAVRRREIAKQNNAQPLDHLALLVDVGEVAAWVDLVGKTFPFGLHRDEAGTKEVAEIAVPDDPPKSLSGSLFTQVARGPQAFSTGDDRRRLSFLDDLTDAILGLIRPMSLDVLKGAILDASLRNSDEVGV